MNPKIILKLKLLFVPCEENQYRPKFLDSQFLFYCAISILVLKLIIVPFYVFLPKTIFFADITKSVLIELTNQKRESLGIQPLKENPKLNEAAYFKAKDMFEKDYFSHQSPEGISPWFWFKKTGYNYQMAGENLAIGFLDSEEVYQAWMESLSHQKNILNLNYKETGIAVLKGDFQGAETTLVVQLFGTPQALVVEKVEKVEKKEPEAVKEVQEKEEPITKGAQEPITKEAQEPITKGAQEPITKEAQEPIRKEEGTKNTLAFNFLSFIASNYYDLLQKIIYGSLIFIIISLMINVLVKFDVQHKDLIFKTVGFIIILVFFILLDKGMIIQLIPHNFSIYSWN